MAEQCEEYPFTGIDTYQLIVDLAEEGIWILNAADVLVFTNKKLQSMLGYTRAELLCHSIYDIIADEYHETVKKAIERRRRGVRETYTLRLKRKDSSLVWVAVAAAPIMDSHGYYKGVISLASDISRVKQSEEVLKKEKALANMYLDLMAHDLNNLNQVAIGHLEIAMEMLRRELPKDRDICAHLRKTMDSMGEQTALINNVKTLQRLKTGQLRHEVVDLGAIIADAIEDYPKIPGRDVTIHFDRPHDCYVRANPLLKEVFTNLIGNSVKHSRGPVTAWITVDSALEKDKTYYEVSVADNGPGIPDDRKGQLFRRFEGDRGRTSGHGLGLYLVRSIAEDFGGRVRVEDRVRGDYSRGAKFVVLLPAAQ